MNGRLIVGRVNGDVVAGDEKRGEVRALHLRNFEIETSAACEALRLLKAKETPRKAGWCVFQNPEGAFRNATPKEIEQHYRWRVWEYWNAMRDVMPPPKAKKLGKKARVTP